MANLQEIIIFSAVVAVMVVFLVYFYYRGEEIMDHVEEEINPIVWTANKLRLDVCNLPFSNHTGKCMDPDYCGYEEIPKYLDSKVLKCKIFTDFICCPQNDSVLE